MLIILDFPKISSFDPTVSESYYTMIRFGIVFTTPGVNLQHSGSKRKTQGFDCGGMFPYALGRGQ